MTLTNPTPAPAVPPGTPGPHTPPDAVHCTIDGVEVTVPKGTLIIRAAEQIGIEIPRFCDHPLLEPAGACRQCLVEVEGQRKPVASCTMPVTDGMVVRTQLTSPVADKAQQGMMELLLINHPLDCPICDKGGECPLQNQAMSTGRTETRFVDRKRTYPKPLPISTQVLLDRERCVLCARCTRFSEEIAGDPFIELMERGALEQVAIYEDEPFESYFSGNTIQICPVGALTGAQYRFRARPFDLRSEPSVCEHCASGCAQRTDHRRGKVMRRLAGDDRGGQRGVELRQGPLGLPLRHRHRPADHPAGPARRRAARASWPEAWAAAADGLPAARDDGRRRRADRWPADRRGRLRLRQVRPGRARHQRHRLPGPAPLGRGGRRSSPPPSPAGPGTGAVTYDDLDAAPAVLLVGFEPEEESPIVFLRLRKAVRKRRPARCSTSRRSRTRAAEKLDATVLTTLPGAEAQSLRALADGTWGGPALEALRAPGAIVLVGERLAEVPGAFSALLGLARATGARLAWVPRRAGDRGAVEAGACRTCCPVAARSPTRPRAPSSAPSGASTSCPRRRAATRPRILTAAATGELGGLVVGGVDPADLPDPRAGRGGAGLGRLRGQPGDVPDRGHRAGRRRPAGRRRVGEGRHLPRLGGPASAPSTRPCTAPGALPDGRVLDALADEMDVDLRLPAPEAARAELAALGAVRRPGEGVGLDVPRPAPRCATLGRRARRRCSPPGASCSTSARCSATSPSSPAPPGPPVVRLGHGRRRAARRRRRRPADRRAARPGRSPCRCA